MSKRFLFSLLVLTLISTLILASCGGANETPVATDEPAATDLPAPTEPAGQATTTAPEATTAATEAAATDVPVETRPISGTLVMAVGQEPDTLDMHKTALGTSFNIMWWAGGALLAIRDGVVGPSLAEAWTVSEDGTSIEFTLKQGVTFHDGTPLTAEDWAYTFTRSTNPETASPAAGPSLGALLSAEALDDYTLKLTWEQANAGIFAALADRGYNQPISQEAVEGLGEEYGRNPVGVGPFMFEEWVTGDHITLVNNEFFTWGPPSDDAAGPYSIQRIEFRIIPEYSTRLAGFEAGEVDNVVVEPPDVDRISEMDITQMFSFVGGGFGPYLAFNLSKAPWNDINVRKAIYMAIDRQAMVDLVLLGKGEVQSGPLSPTTMGYANVDDLALDYDVAAANAMLDEAGYAAGADGIREKDGQRLSYTLHFFAGDPTLEKTATVLQSALKEIGIEVELLQGEIGSLFPQLLAGDYDLMLSAIGYNEADILYQAFHSAQIGALNYHFSQDPELDALLEAGRATMDLDARQDAQQQIQEYLLENVIYVPLFAANNYIALNTRVKDASLNANYFQMDYSAAYIEE